MHRFIFLLTIWTAPGGLAHAQDGPVLQVGAVRINVTPAADSALPMSGYAGRTEGFTGIHDSLYYRVIVIDDGRTRAAIIAAESIGIPERWWEELSSRIELETGIPRAHVILAATHTHGAPQPQARSEAASEKLTAHSEQIADLVVRGIHSAGSRLEQARIGVGRGQANVNINRTARTASGAYWLGQNPDGPSDKTVHVVRFERLDGQPIAILANYAVHGTVGGQGNLMLTGDLPGAASRYAEEHFGNDVVVAWTSGAAGDQNPVYAVLDNLDGGRIQPLKLQGRILGEEIVRVAENIERTTMHGPIYGGQMVVSVPGKQPDEYSPTGVYSFVDADSLSIRLSLLRIGTVALAGVSGEVLTRIGRHLKEQSPFRETIMITHANGASGYLPADEDYETPGYEVMVSRAKEGAETAIVEGLLDLMRRP
jgi:neutral ceramidase